MAIQQTYSMIKPDGVRNGHIGEIVNRFERAGLTIERMEMGMVTPEQAKANYAEHEGKPFCDGLIAYITSGPVVKMVVSGEGAVAKCRSLMGATNPAEAAPGTIRGDFGLNIVNSRAMRYLREQGLDSQLLSFELTLPQIRDISKAVPAELLIYGRLPLMLMENCVMKNRTGICACQTGTVRLVDRVGEEFPIVKDPGTCRNVLLNGKKLYLLDKKDALRGMGLWALRLQFTTENPGEIDKVLMDYQGRAVFDAGSYTRGLYSRGVE